MNDEQKNAVRLIKTCRGQLDGIINMIESGRYCIDISNQLMASQSLLKKAQKNIIHQHLNHCVADALESGSKEEAHKKSEEISELIGKLLEGER